MSEELKPVNCGCGGEAFVSINGFIEYHVVCASCGLRTDWFRSKDKAITAWNKAMGTENICKNCKAYFVMGDCGYCKYDDEYPTADGYGCNCFSRRES